MKIPSEIYIRLDEKDAGFTCTVRYLGVGIPVYFPIEPEAQGFPEIDEDSGDFVGLRRTFQDPRRNRARTPPPE